jgi:hypothetical protein
MTAATTIKDEAVRLTAGQLHVSESQIRNVVDEYEKNRSAVNRRRTAAIANAEVDAGAKAAKDAAAKKRRAAAAKKRAAEKKKATSSTAKGKTTKKVG